MRRSLSARLAAEGKLSPTVEQLLSLHVLLLSLSHALDIQFLQRFRPHFKVN